MILVQVVHHKYLRMYVLTIYSVLELLPESLNQKSKQLCQEKNTSRVPQSRSAAIAVCFAFSPEQTVHVECKYSVLAVNMLTRMPPPNPGKSRVQVVYTEYHYIIRNPLSECPTLAQLRIRRSKYAYMPFPPPPQQQQQQQLK